MITNFIAIDLSIIFIDSTNPQRRDVLKKVSASVLTGSVGTVVSSGAAVASSGISDSAWDDYEPWQTDEEYEQCSGDLCVQESTSDPDNYKVPNPGTFGFDICVQFSNGDELCMSQKDTITGEYLDCAGRKVWKVGHHLTKWEEDTGGMKLLWEQEAWIGLDAYYCYWVGIDPASGPQVCKSLNCPTWNDPTIWEFRDELQSPADEYMRLIREHNGGLPADQSGDHAAGYAAAGGGAYLAYKYMDSNSIPG